MKKLLIAVMAMLLISSCGSLDNVEISNSITFTVKGKTFTITTTKLDNEHSVKATMTVNEKIYECGVYKVEPKQVRTVKFNLDDYVELAGEVSFTIDKVKVVCKIE